MRVLHLSATKTWGGGENHIENLCYELDGNKEIKNYIFCAKNGLFHERLKNKNIEFFTAPLANKMDLRYIFKLGVTCKKHKIDIIHLHDTTAITLAVMADHIFNLPAFVFSKKTSFPIKDRKQTLFKYNYPKIKKVLCVSEASKAVSAEKINDKLKLTTIYHGTRMDDKKEKASFSLRERLKIAPEKIIVGNIANHIRAKNLETLILTANHLIKEMGEENFHFVQIGRFSSRTPKLQEMLTKHDLNEHFSFLDFVPDASSFIKQFDIFMISSQSEGVPQVIYESFYYQVPVVSTNVGGIPEAITHKESGLLADAHDYKKLAEQALTLSRNETMRKSLTKRGREILEEKFSTKSMAQKTFLEYKKILNGQS